MNLRWVVMAGGIGLSFWTGCRTPGDDWTPVPDIVGSETTLPGRAKPELEAAPEIESEPAVAPTPGMAEVAGEVPTPSPSMPAPEAEAPDETTTAPLPETGLIPQFEAARPERLSMPVPVFPEDVDFEGVIAGWVDFMVQIDAAGTVIEARVLDSSNSILEGPAEAAMRAATYTVVRDPRGVPLLVSFRDRVEF